MRFRHFAAALAALALTGCGGNDELTDNVLQQEPATAKTYMKVNIGFPDGGTISRGYSEGEFVPSTTEHAIKAADFYFYDKSGNFYAKHSEANGLEDTDQTGAFESKASATIQVEKVKDFPGYLVVVLNAADVDLSGLTLAQAGAKLTEKAVAPENNKDATVPFVMTNSTYDGTKAKEGTYLTDELGGYFATPLSEANFKNDPALLDDASSVDVYVERLAVKVQVDINEKFKTTFDLAVDASEAEGEVADKVTVKILGWGLNAKEKSSYLMKNIDPTWDFDKHSWGIADSWNDPTNRRSYWAKSANYKYAVSNYPATFADAKPVWGEKADVEPANNLWNVDGAAVDYFSFNELKSQPGTDDAEYCRENTLSMDHLNANVSSSATSVLIAAQIQPKDEKEKDYYLFGGTLYTKDNLLGLLMNNAANGLQVYYVANEGNGSTAEFKQLSSDDFTFVSPYDGYVCLELDKKYETTVWYNKVGDSYLKNNSFEASLKKVNEMLLEKHTQGFKGGRMYYNIPIEHLGKFNPDSKGTFIKYSHADYAGANVVEGQYGVVRNNLYKVTVNSITNLGKGVFNPDEDIVPNTAQSPLWYLTAKINVLSWQIVDQETKL